MAEENKYSEAEAHRRFAIQYMEDFDWPVAYECIARAYASTGNRDKALKYIFLAEAAGQSTENGMRALAFSPDEKTVALSVEGKVQLWSVEPWGLQAELPISTKVVNGIAFSPDGRWLAAGAADRRIRIWELA